MNPGDLISRYPRLYHMAEGGSWESIRKHGLLSAGAIVQLLDCDERERLQYLKCHRAQKVMLQDARLGSFVLRDQKPMNDERLGWCLTDNLTPEDWYATLNSKVFFWVSRERLLRLLGARAYRNEEQDVLTVDTKPIVSIYAKQILLAHMNTGNTFPYPAKRGLSTFKRISDYPTTRDRKAPKPEVVELVVEDRVSDIASHVIVVERMKGPTVLRRIYERG